MPLGNIMYMTAVNIEYIIIINTFNGPLKLQLRSCMSFFYQFLFNPHFSFSFFISCFWILYVIAGNIWAVFSLYSTSIQHTKYLFLFLQILSIWILLFIWNLQFSVCRLIKNICISCYSCVQFVHCAWRGML